MPDPSNGSFIPKRGAAKQRQRGPGRQVYIFTVVSYVVMFATLLAAGGVYLYQGYVETQRDEKIAELIEEIDVFDESKMQHVLDFDSRLTQASHRLSNSASMVAVLQALETTTIESVKFESLNIARTGDESYHLTGVVETDTFDSAIFQREVHNDKTSIAKYIESAISEYIVTGVQHINATDQKKDADTTKEGIGFTVEATIPLSAVPYGATLTAEDLDIVITDPALDSLSGLEESSDDQAESLETEVAPEAEADDLDTEGVNEFDL